MKSEELQDAVPWKRVRYIMSFLGFFSLAQGFATRGILSIAIVAMTDKSTNPDYETWDWDSSTKTLLLSSFFFGYVPSNLFGSMLMQRFGVRKIMIGTSLANVLFTALTPIMASSFDWPGVLICRIMQGLFQGVLFPSIPATAATWGIPKDIAAPAIVMAGNLIGSALVLAFGGILAGSNLGWPSIFYVFSGFSLLFTFAWLFMGFDTPSDHPFITDIERSYMESNVPKFTYKHKSTPWKHILLSVPVWGLTVTHVAQGWVMYMMLNGIPTYMDAVLKFNIGANGVLSALPYLLMTAVTFIFGYISVWLVDHNILSLKVVRKLFNSIGLLGPMAIMIASTFVGYEENYLAAGLFFIALGAQAGVNSGFQVNHVELSNNFAGTLMGMANGIGNIASGAVTLIQGSIVYNEEDKDQWNTLFWITAGVCLLGGLSFIFFSAHEKQPWNEVKSSNDDETSIYKTTL